MKFRNSVKTLSVLLAAAVIALSFTSCSMEFSTTEPAITGTWDAGYGCTWTITDSSFSVENPAAYNWDYSGDIVKWSNRSFNDYSENPSDADNFGYILIKYTAHTGDSSYIGSYTVVRWKSLVTEDGTTTVQFSEGSLYGADSITDAGEALSTVTEENGYFSYGFNILTLTE